MSILINKLIIYANASFDYFLFLLQAPAIAEPQSLPAEVPSLHLTDLGGAEDDSSSEEGEEEEMVDIKQAWEDQCTRQ